MAVYNASRILINVIIISSEISTIKAKTAGSFNQLKDSLNHDFA